MIALKTLCALIFAASIQTHAAGFPVEGLRLNPALRVNISEIKVSGDKGFVLHASNGEFEAVIKGIPMKTESAAKEMSNVEMANIKNLYNPRGSPYAGQISEIIECDKEYHPQTAWVKIDGKKIEALLAGTNARKLFGTCNHDQLAYWAEYFTFYDGKGGRNIDVRVYTKFNQATPANLRKVSGALRAFTAKLIVDANP